MGWEWMGMDGPGMGQDEGCDRDRARMDRAGLWLRPAWLGRGAWYGVFLLVPLMGASLQRPGRTGTACLAARRLQSGQPDWSLARLQRMHARTSVCRGGLVSPLRARAGTSSGRGWGTWAPGRVAAKCLIQSYPVGEPRRHERTDNSPRRGDPPARPPGPEGEGLSRAWDGRGWRLLLACAVLAMPGRALALSPPTARARPGRGMGWRRHAGHVVLPGHPSAPATNSAGVRACSDFPMSVEMKASSGKKKLQRR